MRIQSLTGAWSFQQAGAEEWLPGAVPGGVHTDLLHAGCIPDPFVADNENTFQWVAEADWQYRYRFACEPGLLDEEQVWLACDGLDTLATVTLNGQELGRTDNMFRQYRWEVKGWLHGGSGADANELLITFASPVRYAAQKMDLRSLPGVPQAIPGGPYLRKAPCQFGWDWGPQLPPIGIWKDIRLEGYSGARIEDVHLRQRHNDGQVTVEASLSIDYGRGAPADISGQGIQGNLGRPYVVTLRVTAPDGEVVESSGDPTSLPFAAISSGGEATGLGDPSDMSGQGVQGNLGRPYTVQIAHPQLWWPNGYGPQPLYQVEVTVRRTPEEPPSDVRTFQIGLRTIELRQADDPWGRSFVFVVNGTSIFAKGSNWIPADSFPTRITDGYLEGLIASAAETHQNMLRVWGGGFYEEERFYDLCDRYGILVWQEFIFSCSVYPLDDPEFLENVRVEAVENIRRLRHRASLALWCGNNEMEWGWVDWGWKGADMQDMKTAYDRFFHHTLPAWCAAEDPDHSYWPSSPSSNTPFESPNGQRQGDAHYWDVWHGRKPFTAYRDQYPRFMSEFGFQALPPLATIRTYAGEADWNMTSYIMEQHQKNASGNSLMVGQMLDTFRLPMDFETLVYLSLALQAEGIRYGVEHWRRHPERVAGTLYWQLNDCWPVASWASLDYFGRWKALHYAARRFYAPLMLSIEDKPTSMGIYVTNDLLEPWEGAVRWWLETLDGRVLESGQSPVRVEPQSAIAVRSLDFSDHLSDDTRRELVFITELVQGERRIALQAASFVPTKHLELHDPQVRASLRSEEDRLVIELEARSLARLVEVLLEGADVVFTDNYFDLPAGRRVAIACPLPADWTLEQAHAALRIRSVYDSFAHPTRVK